MQARQRRTETAANAVLMHPNDAETLDLLQVNAELNHFVGSGPYGPLQRSVWE